MITIKPEAIFKYRIFKWIMWLGFLSPVYAVIDIQTKTFNVIFSGIFMLWAGLLACFILLVANGAAIENAYKTNQLTEPQYRFCRARSIIGQLLFGAVSLGLGVFLVMTSFRLNTSLTITAVPTPELIAEIKYFFGEKNLEYSDIIFDGSEQEITFYSDDAWRFHENSRFDLDVEPTKFRYGTVDFPSIKLFKGLCYLARTFDEKHLEYNQSILLKEKYRLFSIHKNTILYPADDYYAKDGIDCIYRGDYSKNWKGRTIDGKSINQYEDFRDIYRNFQPTKDSFFQQTVLATVIEYSFDSRLSVSRKFVFYEQ